jgi:regulator of protease activity HflC (stomatin/prohibitin superfamily)
MAYRDGEDLRITIFRILGRVALVIIIISLILGSFFVVRPGEKALVFNSFTGLREGTYGEGMHLKLPLVEHPIKMNVRVQKQSEEARAASADLQDVSTTVAVNFVVDQSKLPEIYRTIGQSTGGEDYMRTNIMNPIIQESVKAVTATFTADELITERERVKQGIDNLIRERMGKYNIIVQDVSITNFEFSEVFTEAIEAKVTAEQNALREQNNLLVVKYQAEQLIEQARGEAEAIRIINEELRSSPAYVDYLTIQKWDGKMPLALGSGSLLSITGDEQKASTFS